MSSFASAYPLASIQLRTSFRPIRTDPSLLSKHILGQRINSHSSEQTNLTGSLDPLPDLFVLFPLLTGLVDGVNVFVGELHVSDGEVPSETVGAGRGGDEDGSARKV